tara:strand:+ start:2706 stop:2825 length:120 start_codon:yes stop_codon:yes gene_type:complete
MTEGLVYAQMAGLIIGIAVMEAFKLRALEEYKKATKKQY